MPYNIYFDVKYKRIENDLREKYKEKEEEHEDIDTVIEQLYIHELSSVLSVSIDVDNFPPPECQDTLSTCWDLVKDQPEFMELMQLVKDNHVALQFFVNDVETLFIIFFSFDLFHALHPCLCDRMHGKPISGSSLQLLREAILEIK